MSNQFKHYIGYKNDLLYNAPITKKILSGNQLEKNYDKYIEYIRKSSKIINEPVYDWWLAFNDDFNYKNLLSFEPYSNDNNLLKNKLYFVFNAPVLVSNNWWDDIEESTEIFGWYPEIKDGRLLFSRIIKNQKLDKIKTDFLNFPSHISRHIAMKSYIFDLDKLVLNLGINLNKFNIEEHIRINFNKIYKNFDNDLPKNSISNENDLIKLLKNNGISNRQYNFWKQQIDNLDDESLLNKFLFEKYLIVPN